MSVAVLMLVVGGATFNHPVAGHDHSGHEHADTLDHHHGTGQSDIEYTDTQTVHCGANLLTLTCEFEPIAPTGSGDLEPVEAAFVMSKSSTVEPPPPRLFS